MKKSILPAFLGLLLSFWSCEAQLVLPKVAPATGRLEILLETNSRTILPSYTYQIEDFTAELRDQDGVLVVEERFSAGSLMAISEIHPGNYTLVVTAFAQNGDPIMRGSENILVNPGENTTFVELTGLLSGTGSLRLDLRFPEQAPVDFIEYSLVPLGELPLFSPISFFEGSIEIFGTGIPAGNYELLVNLYIQGEIVCRVFEVVWIRGNAETSEDFYAVEILGLELPPTAPSDFSATYQHNAVTLEWEDTSSVETGFILEVSVNGGAFEPLVVLEHSVTQYVDTELESNTTRTYRIKAVNDYGQSDVVISSLVEVPSIIEEQTLPPVFQPGSGVITQGSPLLIIGPTPDSSIYYTLDGSLPTTASERYQGPIFLLEGEALLRAICIAPGYLASDVVSASYQVIPPFRNGVRVHAKGFTHVWGWDDEEVAYTGDIWPGVLLEDEGDGWGMITFQDHSYMNLIFSNDGSAQTGNLRRETGEWWWDGEWHNTDPDAPRAPEFVEVSPSPGLYNSSQTIILESEYSGDEVYYTLDGSTPTEESLAYNGAFLLEASSVIKVIAFRSGLASNIFTFDFTIDPNADLEPPSIIPDKPVQRYEDPVDVVFTLWDNAATTTVAHYTLDGTVPTANSPIYVHGNAQDGLSGPPITLESNTNVRFFLADGTLNITSPSFYYPIGPVMDPSRVDFREETVYFLMTTRFYDGDLSNTRVSPSYESSGNADYNDPSWRGDFQGLIEKLDYIKALGFTAIWITPPVLNRNYYDYHGYHGWDFTRIDGRLESPGATYQDLIDEVHARDMKIIQDIVINHSGRYGLNDVAEVQYWGDREDPDWGKDSEINYYDEYNPNFEYDGVSVEPLSGKSWYNGDVWTKEFPEYVTWDPVDEYYYWDGTTHSHLSDPNLWGLASPYSSPEGYQVYHFQWPGMYESQFVLLDPDWFHNFWLKNWEDYTSQFGTIHEDCLDLDTESQVVQDYLIDAYNRYIQMGVDGFRIDTVKHVSRNTFNRVFNPAFMEAAQAVGNEDFYMVGEVCVRDHGVWNKGNPALSQPFYTWKERTTYSQDDAEAAFEAYIYETGRGSGDQPTSDNHLLIGNQYREPDYSEHSGMNVIDFRMHWNFASAGAAFGVRDGDQYTNDATWNMTYVESHDYSPMEVGNSLYARMSDADVMAENWSLMFTWRGIPTIFYGNEILFKAGEIIDEGPNRALEESGRAYFGPHVEGDVQVMDFGVWQNATGEMANTLSHPLALHLQRLNQIRRAIPALQKGQYSTDGINGALAFKRRFTDLQRGVDSYALVTISGDASFTNILNGTYVDAVTGDVQTVTNGSLDVACQGKGNLRVYVLSTDQTPAPGVIGQETQWIY